VISRKSGLRRTRRGVTLIEMLLVIGIVGLLAGISYPAITAGVESVRLATACNSLAAFLNRAVSGADRSQQLVEISVDIRQNALWLRSTMPGSERKLVLPQGVAIRAVLPALTAGSEAVRRFVILPGGNIPGFGVELANRKGSRRVVSVDPITGVPRVEAVESQ
jgi:prepilin-type N-terminal cleavage/methylation domain-containing protein